MPVSYARPRPATVCDEIADEQPSTSLSSAPMGAAIQLEPYLGEPTTSQEDKPLQYWRINKVCFPTLAQMLRSYLSASCSSVESERQYGSVSDIVNENRNRLETDYVEKLLFIKKNLPLTILKKA